MLPRHAAAAIAAIADIASAIVCFAMPVAASDLPPPYAAADFR